MLKPFVSFKHFTFCYTTKATGIPSHAAFISHRDVYDFMMFIVIGFSFHTLNINVEQRLLGKPMRKNRFDSIVLVFHKPFDKHLKTLKMCARRFTCKQFSKIIRLTEDPMCVLAERTAGLSGLHLVELNKTKKQNESH